MKSNKEIISINRTIQNILIVLLIVIVVILFCDINKIQGNARVINFVGIVRGNSERIVKLEIGNEYNDKLIEYEDTILYGLTNGGGEYKLISLPDKAYKNKLNELNSLWNKLKKEIYKARKIGYKNTDLIKMSEEYFLLANETASKAELYTDGIARDIKFKEMILFIIIILIITLTIKQTLRSLYLKDENNVLSRVAFIDFNTGIPNKGYCDKKIDKIGHINKDDIYGCIMFDLNNLKFVNDNFGHSAGDLLILNFANLLKKSIDKNTFIGRYGGDEFIAIIKNSTREKIENMLLEMEINLKEYNEYQNTFMISYAYGYAISSDYENINMRMLINKADKNMYDKKVEMKQ